MNITVLFLSGIERRISIPEYDYDMKVHLILTIELLNIYKEEYKYFFHNAQMYKRD